MVDNKFSIVMRPFKSSDTEACFAMRYQAFTRVFSEELSQQAVDAGANAYDPADFGRLISSMNSFVATVEEQPVGFCTVRMLDESTAEILYLYVRLDYVKAGIGSRLVRHVESCIAMQYPGVSRLVLDTAVPLYNQRFWEGMGYSKMKESICRYPGGEIPAVRLGKSLNSSGREGVGS